MSSRADKYMGPIIYDLSNIEILKELCESSHSYSEVINKSGRKCTGGNFQYVKNKIVAASIDVSHFTGRLWSKGKTRIEDDRIVSNTLYKSDEDILGYHPEIPRKIVRGYVLRNNIIPYECALCGNKGEWKGKPMSLHLDHIDGERYDHSKENLRFLCPNCDATTETYTGRNITRKKKNEL